MILASLALIVALLGYAALCTARPFRASGRLRIGRRITNELRRTYDHGTR